MANFMMASIFDTASHGQLDPPRQALVDLAKRVQSGLLLYLILWVLVCSTSGLYVLQPVLAWVGSALFCAIVAVRVTIARNLDRWIHSNFIQVRAIFLASLLSNGLLWGTFTAFLIHEPHMRHLEWPLIFAAVAFCAAGAMVMAIIPVLRFSFVAATLGPIMVSMVYEPSQQHLLVALMCAVFLVYVVVASKAAHADYCEALAGRALLEERARELEALSVTDRLTQIPNRLYFDRHLHMEWSRCIREHQSLTIMVLDLDHFKRINDNYGHLMGDRCLKFTAAAFKAQLRRATDILARFGGEEFVVMLSNTDEQGGLVVARRLLKCLHAIEIPSGDERFSVTCSIGLCTIQPGAGSSAEIGLDLADRALYLAKQRGRNQIAVSSELDKVQLSQDILQP